MIIVSLDFVMEIMICTLETNDQIQTIFIQFYVSDTTLLSAPIHINKDFDCEHDLYDFG